VFVELTAKIRQAVVVCGLENDVPRNLDSIQDDEKVTAISAALEERPGCRTAARRRDCQPTDP
jgi:hypothetical protein